MLSVRGIAKGLYTFFYNKLNKYLGLGVDRSKIFSSIYAKKRWGTIDGHEFYSGVGSHDEDVVNAYVSKVLAIAADRNLKNACDLGAGDFNVGKRIAPVFEEFIGCDIVPAVVERNSGLFESLARFEVIDICSDQLPSAEIYFVRQVLQHLDNESIAAFVRNIDHQKGAYLLVTEEISCNPKAFMNLDIRVGSGTRVNTGAFGSGVDLAKSPFGVPWESVLREDIWRGEATKITIELFRI